MITDWTSMFPPDSDEYWPELQQQIDHWEQRTSDDPGMFNQLVWGLMVATHRAEAAEARAVTWIPVGNRLPDPMLIVLAVYYDGRKTTTIRAQHLPDKAVQCWGEYDESVYDEETDASYYPGGWYEPVEEQEYAFYGPLPGTVTHWAQLPALPARK